MVLGALAARLGTKPVIEDLRQAADGRDALAQVLDLDVVDAGPRPELGDVPRRPMSSNREAGLRSTVPRAPRPASPLNLLARHDSCYNSKCPRLPHGQVWRRPSQGQ